MPWCSCSKQKEKNDRQLVGVEPPQLLPSCLVQTYTVTMDSVNCVETELYHSFRNFLGPQLHSYKARN